MLQKRPMDFQHVGHHGFFFEQGAVSGGVELMIDEKFLAEKARVSAGENDAARAEYFMARNQNIDVGAYTRSNVAVERLGQGDALERDHEDASLSQQTEQPGQFFREELVAKRVGEESAFQFGLNSVGDSGGSEEAQVAMDKRVNLVTVRAFQKQRPPQRRYEDLPRAGLLVG